MQAYDKIIKNDRTLKVYNHIIFLKKNIYV